MRQRDIMRGEPDAVADRHSDIWIVECDLECLDVASPLSSGSTSGGGPYANGSQATVTAKANPGFAFLNWTENGNAVSTSAIYAFTVTSNRTLVANFVQVFTLTVQTLGSAQGGVSAVTSNPAGISCQAESPNGLHSAVPKR